MATYGARKAECERRLLALGPAAGMAVFIGRPAIVYGPHDYTDRRLFNGGIASGIEVGRPAKPLVVCSSFAPILVSWHNGYIYDSSLLGN